MTTTAGTTTLEALASVIARASSEPSFRSEVVKSPANTLKSNNVGIPSGTSVKVAENTDTIRNLVMPAAPPTLTAEEQQELKSLANSSTTPSSPVDAYAKVVLQAWFDGTLKSQLQTDPRAVLAKAGISVPTGITINMLDETATLDYLVLAPAVTLTAAQKTNAEAEAETLDPNLTQIITAGSYAAGLAFAGTSTLQFKVESKGGDPTAIKMDTAIALAITSAALVFVPESITHTGNAVAQVEKL